MKNLIKLFFLLILIGSCKSEKKYYLWDIVTPNDSLTYLKFDMERFTGTVHDHYGIAGKFINGMKDGDHKEWYRKNELKSVKPWKNGIKDGDHKEWYFNGKLKSVKPWKNGKREGLFRIWYDNGQLQYESNYKNDKLEGLERFWNKDGTFGFENKYKNGIEIN